MKRVVLIIISVFSISSLYSQDTLKTYLWDNAPFAQGNSEEDKPSVTVWFPAKEKANGAAVLICPGGGYISLALDHEGKQVAKWFNDLGITAIVLKYRVGTWDHKKYKHPVPFMDISRAMRYVRANAKKWNLNPEQIGVMGFSAGGHLASCLATMWDDGNPKATNNIDKYSSKPNFLALIYPVITFSTKHAFQFGRGVLLGDDASREKTDSLSTELRVTTHTPPTFIMYTDEDDINPMNGVLFYNSLRENKIPAELHIYEKGAHGYGLYPKEKSIQDWPDRLKNWLNNRRINFK